MLHYSFFVNNSHLIFNLSSKILGHTITEKVIKNTMGHIFTGGSSIQDIMNLAESLKSRRLPIIVDYCCEALEDNHNEDFMDKSASVFEDTVKIGDYTPSHKISLKVSAICDLDTLKNLNIKWNEMNKFFSEIDTSSKGYITGAELKSGLSSKRGINVEDSEVLTFMTDILDVEGASMETQISWLTWRMKVHPFYIDFHKNEDKIVSSLANINQEVATKTKNFVRRMTQIFDSASKNQTRVLMDAEQTYMQRTIDSFIEQFQYKYNKKSPIVYNTFQNYLKSSAERVQYEIAKCKALNMPFGIKMVRGAYINEENSIAKKQGIESPICEGLSQTAAMMDKNLAFVIDNLTPGSELLIGSHNRNTVNNVCKLMAAKNIPKNTQQVYFSQLLGLADHLSYSLVDQGYSIFKYIPFGETRIMIPYLIRRAQESFQVLSSVEFQYQLLKNEVSQRIKQN